MLAEAQAGSEPKQRAYGKAGIRNPELETETELEPEPEPEPKK